MHLGMTAVSVFLMQRPSQPFRRLWRELRKHFSFSGGLSLFDVDNYSTTKAKYYDFVVLFLASKMFIAIISLGKRMTRWSSWGSFALFSPAGVCI